MQQAIVNYLITFMTDIERDELIVKKYLESTLTLFDDSIFSKVAKNLDFIQELLQIILDDKYLKVLKCEVQKTVAFSKQHGIRLDCLCKLQNGSQVNVEVEKNDPHSKWNDQKRVRFYGSVIDVSNLNQKEDYDKLPDLYMIYITLKDIFGKGKTTYHIERHIVECNEYVNNGYHEIYVNAENNDESDISEVMRMMSTQDYVNNKYKSISKVKEEMIMPVEVKEAMDRIRSYERSEGKAEGIAEGKAKGKAEIIFRLFKQGIISEQVALSNLEISKEKFNKKLSESKI